MIKAHLKKDFKVIDRLEREIPNYAGAAVVEAANALVHDIDTSWSPNSPSPEGEPPAVVSENLRNSIFIGGARDKRGHFTQDAKGVSINVVIDTSKGPTYHGRGEYAFFLEDGTTNMHKRPFLDPAVERLEATFPEFFSRIFKQGSLDMEE